MLFGGAVVNSTFPTEAGEPKRIHRRAQNNSLGNFSGTGGINSVTQFTGDNNNVNVTVNIEVNLNTVTVSDSAGAVISTNQTLDLAGVVGGINQ